MALRRERWLGGGLLLATLLSTGGGAQPIVGDPRVETSLKELKWAYKTDEDGDFNVVMQTESGRTQLVIIRSRTFSVGKLEQREIWSAAALTDGEVPPEAARALLSDSLQVKIGFWATLPQEEGKKQLLLYVARVPASCDSGSFAEYCQGVAEVADDLEKELTNKDDY